MILSPSDRWLLLAVVGVVIAFLLIAYGKATGRVDTQQPPRVRVWAE
jgi:hypothetical protein